jgi:hypothetical protein
MKFFLKLSFAEMECENKIFGMKNNACDVDGK